MDPAPSLMERWKQDAADEIAGQAIALFLQDGFEATTVEAISAAAGVSRRTFYRYFGSKEDVAFHGLPEAFDQLREVLDGHLAEGLDPWAAVSASVVDMIARFAGNESIPVRRMALWLREPALHGRYLHHVVGAERTIVDCLCRHRRTTPERDDVAQLMAIAAVGAYRTTVATHGAAGNSAKLTKHLRSLLATVGAGLA